MARIPNDPNIPLQNYHPKPSGTTVFWQLNGFPVLGLTLDDKKMDWSQAEQWEPEPPHLVVANLHWPVFMQRRKDKVWSCLEDFEVQVPQTPAVHDQNWLHHCSEFNQNPGKKGLIYRCHEPNPLALLQFHQHAHVCVCTQTHSHASKWWGWCFKVSRRWGKKEGVRFFCLPCTAVSGSSRGGKSHHWSRAAHTILLSCNSKHTTGKHLPGSARSRIRLKLYRMVSHFYIKPTKPNPRYSQRIPQPAGVWKWFSPCSDTPSQHEQSWPPPRKALSHQ